jgi:hypothetical protein
MYSLLGTCLQFEEELVVTSDPTVIVDLDRNGGYPSILRRPVRSPQRGWLSIFNVCDDESHRTSLELQSPNPCSMNAERLGLIKHLVYIGLEWVVLVI